MNTPDMVHMMWSTVANSGTQDVMITWRATDGRTRVGRIFAEYAPHVYAVRVLRSWQGQEIPADVMHVYADEISFAQYA